VKKRSEKKTEKKNTTQKEFEKKKKKKFYIHFSWNEFTLGPMQKKRETRCPLCFFDF
jgi:phosphoserine aminotransferase